MYTTCLFCSASLGTNEAIEAFPVGARVAFDAWKGRLWAVCSRCGRWNLAPLEERWEAVEAAEKIFTDCRARVHSENIGLCKLPDGTRLIRVGDALPGELAAWRYGRQLISRRNRNLAYGGLGVLGVGAVLAGLPLIAGAGIPVGLLNLGIQANVVYHERRRRMRVVYRMPASQSPTGAELIVRRMHLYDAIMERAPEGELHLRLLMPQMHPWKRPAPGWQPPDAEPLVLTGHEARRVLARAMSDYNASGASRQEVQHALKAIETAGGAEQYAVATAASGAAIARRARRGRTTKMYSLRQIAGTFRGEILPVEKYRDPFSSDDRPHLSRTEALALEMALNEEAERTALDGELVALEAAWREAEEIAGIADSLIAVAGPRATASQPAYRATDQPRISTQQQE